MSESTQNFVIYMSVSVSSLISLIVICSVVLIPFKSGASIPDVLENWGGLIIGFYFGSFVGLLKDWSGLKRADRRREQNPEVRREEVQ